MTGFAYAGAAVGIGVVLTRSSQEGRVVWILAEPVDYALTARSGVAFEFQIPAGTSTDGASVPLGLHWLVPPVEYRTFLPSALHDMLWTARQAAKASGRPPLLTRVAIDHVFRQALRAEGVGKLKRWAMWAAVRAQAWWSRDR